MTLKEALAKLESMGDEKRRAWNAKQGLGKLKQFGVATGDIRALAKKIKTDHDLALQLWKTDNIDAQLLAILLMKPKELSAKELDKMVRAATFVWVADWLNSYIVKEQPPGDKETLRLKWMEDDDGWAAPAAWNLTASRIAKGADGLDLPALLDRIESEMADTPPETQWTMNCALAEIGIHFAKHRGSGRSTREVLKLGTAVLAAPDLDVDVVIQRASTARLGKVPERAIVYICKDDEALGFSRLLFGGLRLGTLKPDIFSKEELEALRKGHYVAIIDARVTKPGAFGHNYFYSNPAVSSDLILAVRYEKAAGAENGRPLGVEENGFWYIGDEYPKQGK